MASATTSGLFAFAYLRLMVQALKVIGTEIPAHGGSLGLGLRRWLLQSLERTDERWGEARQQ